jgi:nitrate/TMAO reductase-like tetraheme cytochrome c subunit
LGYWTLIISTEKGQTMKKTTIILIAFIIAVAGGIISSCASATGLTATKEGAQLWAENCLRCHNPPSPDTFSDADWEVALTHMRVRANLTAREADLVVAFLKTAN